MPVFTKSAILTFIIGLLIPVIGYAQSEIDRLKPGEYFDFWVGTWDLSWRTPDGSVETGTNHIEKILGGSVILENFEAKAGRMKGYRGKSFSVYQKQSGTWKQTWVDSDRGYIDMIGKIDGDKRIFMTETTGPDGKKMIKRMVFYDITGNAFTWDWESSSDNGNTWKLLWRIHYKRRDASSP